LFIRVTLLGLLSLFFGLVLKDLRLLLF
jgi:hypothetical protein